MTAIVDPTFLAVTSTPSMAPSSPELTLPLRTGGGLSAGEAQLLAFARVFLKDPGLVVLDEASSRLDPTSDRLIERALDKLLDGASGGTRRTAIIIDVSASHACDSPPWVSKIFAIATAAAYQ